MTTTTTVLTLYSVAGFCETAAVAVTALDLRAKARAAADFEVRRHPTSVRDTMIEAAAAARGGTTYQQLERINEPLLAALRGPWLVVAAALLVVGVVVGTVANALSSTSS